MQLSMVKSPVPINAPENGYYPKRQANGMEEYKTFALGLTRVKKKTNKTTKTW